MNTARELNPNKKKPRIVSDYYQDGVRVVIISHYSHFCAYVGIPTDHPLAGFDYDDLPVQAHGGLTFGKEGDDDYLPKGYYWYGCDYAHSGDLYYCKIDGLSFGKESDKDWTLEQVKEDIWDMIYDISKLKTLVEKIHNNK